MAYKYREEIVGKRFLSVSGFTKLKLGKITEWGWRSGVIRAASHKDNKHKDLQVLVEYDDVEWHRREWISIYKDSLFHFFLVEQALVWSERRDPYISSHNTVLWPALTFLSLVSSVDISSQSQPVEFLLDRELAFKDYSRLQPFTEWDGSLSGVRDYPELRAEVRRWAELQDGQRILLTTPSVLVGYRVEVYRAEGTTQWYTAVIVGYNEATRDLTVTDDTVLEEHNEDPALVQMRLIGDGVVESIMRGENVGITPRRSRSALLHAHHHTLPSSRLSRGVCVATARTQHSGAPAASVPQRKPRAGRPAAPDTPPTPPSPPPAANTPPSAASNTTASANDTNETTKGGKAQRKRKCSENDSSSVTIKPRQNSNSAYSNKEDLENKQGRKRNSYTRGAKKKVLEEANNSKLRHVEVRVEDCLHNGPLSALCRRDSHESDTKREVTPPAVAVAVAVPAAAPAPVSEEPEPEESKGEEEREQEEVIREEEDKKEVVVEDSNSTASDGSSVQLVEDVGGTARLVVEAASEEDDCVIVAEEPSRGGDLLRKTEISSGSSSSSSTSSSSSVGVVVVGGSSSNSSVVVSGPEGSSIGGSSVVQVGGDVVVVRGDDVVLSPHTSPYSCSSSRMDMGDGTASGLLRFADDRSDSGVSSLRSGCASGDERSGSRSSALSSSDEPPPPQTSATAAAATAAHPNSVRVWRDPNLLLEEPQVRHIHSVQHQSLLMSHPASAVPAPAVPAAPASSSNASTTTAVAASYSAVVVPPGPVPGVPVHPSLHPSLHHPHSHVPPPPPHHHLPPPGLYPQLPEMLWKPRYPPLSVGLLGPQAAHPNAEELFERERAYAQDRLSRERRDHDLRDMEKQQQQHKKREEERERERIIERERERQEREKLEREREREKQERERQDRIEREQERERQEKQRAEQAVHKHFEESLRLAHQKQFVDSLQRDRNHMPWNLFSIPAPQRNSSTAAAVAAAEEDRKRAEQEHQQREQHRQLAATERLRQEARDRAFYSMTTQPRSSVSAKTDYPPPAHSRVSQSMKANEKLSVSHTSLPKAEPNISLFGYPSYQPGAFITHDSKVKMEHHKQPSQSSQSLIVNKSSSAMIADRDRELVLTNPPPLINEMKSSSSSSVIVKHEVKSPHHLESKVSVAHSPSPKLMAHYSIPTTSATQHKTLYEYRSPTQSPHHLQHPHTPSPHHRPPTGGSTQLPSPHALHQRQSPHSLHSHGRNEPQMYQASKAVSSSAYSYLPPAPATIGTTATHYALPVSSAGSGSKPKVSSPAPPHIYGKPNAGITTGIPPMARVQEVAPPSNPIPLTSKPPLPSSVSPSPYQQVSQYHPPHPHQTSMQATCPPPPPAHSRTTATLDSRAMYERSIYPGGTVPGGLSAKPLMQHHGTSPPTATAAPLPMSRSPHLTHNVPTMHHSPAVQTQPLDLGVSSNRDEQMSTSPKRKGTPLSHHSVTGPIPLDVKKRRLDSPGLPQCSPHQPQQQQPLALHAGNMQPQLARVSEPSPLIASAATTITTVVNTAAYRTPPNTIIISQQPSHHSAIAEVGSDISVTTVPANSALLDNSTNRLTVTTTLSCSPVVSTPTPAPISVSPISTINSPITSSVPVVVTTSTPTAVVQEAPSTPIKVSLTPSVVDSEKSNSPGPIKTTTSNYPVRHLKKAWLQRHTGEDVEDTTGVTGTGSCVTLPIPNVNNSNTTQATKETSSPVTYNIGAMAVNSINKTKSLTNKNNVRKGNTGKDVGPLNGHGTDTNKGDDSSSSDQERGRKSPPKRKPPKVKRKKGGQAIKKTNSEDLKKRKTTVQSTVASESGSDSDKESGSEKDSDSGASTNQASTGKKTTNGGNNSGGTASGGKDKEPKKRGRRPKSSKNDKGEEPRNKKSRDEPSLPQRDPFRKPPVGQLKKTGESFLQDGPCFEVAPKLAKCRECRWTPNQRSKNMPNIFCRFYAFRRLRYTKNGQLAIAGFSDPYKDASEEDLKLWLPLPDSPPPDLDLEMSRLLLHQVGDHFCDLLVQERDALDEHMSDDKTIAWKRVVQGVREMCDVCETTLFNFHWACGKCGFVVCLDCYKGRKNGTIKIWGEPGKDRDEFSWLQCTNRQPHEQEKLMLTQIIAGDSLLKLGRRVHEFRELWCIPQYCACPLSKESKSVNGAAYRDIIKSLIKGELNGIKIEKKEDSEDIKPLINGAVVKEEKKSPLSWLADVALSNEDKKNDDSSDSDAEKEGNFSTLRELLIRPSHKSNGSRAASPANTNTNNNGLSKNAKKSKLETLDEVISSVIEDTVHKADDLDVKSVELKHFVRRYNWQTKGREPLPIRIMTLTESKILYPNTPHSWLCDGKLLRLTESNNPGNYRLFQDQWKRGQPVIVSDAAKNLDMNLWHPDSFIRDFGDEKNDLINCMTGKLVPNQPMAKFWEGFEHFSKRLKDERGNPMLLKLKDWPPGEDFAELMPSRFNDLMNVLPLSEYTHRTGRLNLASRLPECFVRPDLGPKMYNAYGSALYPTKGTTNLHLDISDAVNMMVYVGIPKDGDNDEHIKEAFRAIDEAGCDILTRRRVRDKGELPGALWHIYNARDADKIRDLLNKVALEKGERLEPHHDPIHDQSGYLDGPLRERLYKEYGVEGYAIVQCLGDAVFIPAGAPHQVRNLHNCIKVAEDFVSPENVSHCFHLTQEFRELSDTHSNHEDKLQIKNIIYHTVKDSLSVLSSLLKNHAVKNEDDGLIDSLSNVRESGASSSDSNSPSGSPASQDTDSKDPA